MSVYTWNQKCAVSAAAAMFTLATASAALAQIPSGADAATPIEVRGGTASFDVGSNVPALSVH